MVLKSSSSAPKPKVRADHIKLALSKRHSKDLFLTEVKTGPTHTAKPGELKRLDAVAIARSWTRPSITVYEVKTSRSDFMSDEKWPTYREFGHRLYFACPKGVIESDELPSDVGLIWYNPDTGGLHTRKKALFRDIEIPHQMFYHLVISHMDTDRHPFFSSTREKLEAWLKDKDERKELSLFVKGGFAQRVRKLEQEMLALNWKLDYYKENHENYEELCKLLKDLGISTHSFFSIKMELADLIHSRIPRAVRGEVDQILRSAETLKAYFEELDAAPKDAAEGDDHHEP